MSENNNISQEAEKLEKEASNKESSAKLVVKKKRIKKSDILVFCLCLIVSIGVWMYATNFHDDVDNESTNPKETTNQTENQ